MMVKITCFSFEVVLRIMKHIVIYPDLDPSSDIIVLHPVV
jgi:hypothetical protein